MVINVVNIQCFRPLIKALLSHFLSLPTLPLRPGLLQIRLLTVLQLIIELEWVPFDLFPIFAHRVLEFPWTVPVLHREIFTEKRETLKSLFQDLHSRDPICIIFKLTLDLFPEGETFHAIGCYWTGYLHVVEDSIIFSLPI